MPLNPNVMIHVNHVLLIFKCHHPCFFTGKLNRVNMTRPIKKKTERLLKAIVCHCCGLIFFLCPCCYRGHRYCSKKCRKSAQGAAHRKRQRKYRQTDKGKKSHCDSEKRRRLGKAAEGKLKKIEVAVVACCKSAVEKAKRYIEKLIANPNTVARCHCLSCVTIYGTGVPHSRRLQIA